MEAVPDDGNSMEGWCSGRVGGDNGTENRILFLFLFSVFCFLFLSQQPGSQGEVKRG